MFHIHYDGNLHANSCCAFTLQHSFVGLNLICGIADMSRPLVGPNLFQKSANLERNMHFEFRPKTTQERLPPFLVCKKHFWFPRKQAKLEYLYVT